MKNLKLIEMQKELGICRLLPSKPIPTWATTSEFYSITKTDKELSIVCLQSSIPIDENAELGWKALKVEGPLDFSLTGILASIAQPLANAKISIFALSTFDTDYVLIKSELMNKAVSILRSSGFDLR